MCECDPNYSVMIIDDDLRHCICECCGAEWVE